MPNKNLNENVIWSKVFGGLPKGTIVKVKNRTFRKDYYYGIIDGYYPCHSRRDQFFYSISILPKRGTRCPMWVKPESIIEILKEGDLCD